MMMGGVEQEREGVCMETCLFQPRECSSVFLFLPAVTAGCVCDK